MSLTLLLSTTVLPFWVILIYYSFSALIVRPKLWALKVIPQPYCYPRLGTIFSYFSAEGWYDVGNLEMECLVANLLLLLLPERILSLRQEAWIYVLVGLSFGVLIFFWALREPRQVHLNQPELKKIKRKVPWWLHIFVVGGRFTYFVFPPMSLYWQEEIEITEFILALLGAPVFCYFLFLQGYLQTRTKGLHPLWFLRRRTYDDE